MLDPRLFGKHRRGGRVDVGLQILGIKPRQYLLGSDPIADIDRTGYDLATHPERQVGLNARLDIAGQCHGRGEIRCLDLLDTDARVLRFDRFLLVTSDERGQNPQADDTLPSFNSHAGSLLVLYCSVLMRLLA
ncbi:hypothetical protein D3C81_1634290 [compost metagenome]